MLYNITVLRHIGMDGQKDAENLIMLLSSKLAELPVLTCQELRYVHCSLRLKNLDFPSLYDFSYGWDCWWLNPL